MWGSVERSPSWQGQEGRSSYKDFAVKVMVMDIFSGSAPFPPSNMPGNFLSSLLKCLLIAANGLGVFFGMVS